jgi:uncharacterized membrane protein
LFVLEKELVQVKVLQFLAKAWMIALGSVMALVLLCLLVWVAAGVLGPLGPWWGLVLVVVTLTVLAMVVLSQESE